MRTSIAVGVVCLALGTASAASAQEQEQERDEGAPASVEMSLSISPTFLLNVFQLGSSGVGGLGGLLQPVLDVGFTIDPRLLLVVGVMASLSDTGGGTSVFATVPMSLLWYLETPRVGHVMPMLRVGVSVGYAQYGGGETYELGALARGGITWLADRCIGIRAEMGLHGGVWAEGEGGAASGLLGLDALASVVLRV